jgi:multidrug efflux pump subunit AcrB
VVAAAVPLTLAVVLLIMWATGRAFDRITLGALILALGLLVDDAIIAIEMMVVKMEEAMTAFAPPPMRGAIRPRPCWRARWSR